MGLYHGPYKPLKASWHSFACRWRQKRYPSEHAQTRRILHGAQFVSKLRATAACGDAMRAVREVMRRAKETALLALVVL